MQLVLIPVLLIAGIALIAISSNGVPSLSALLNFGGSKRPAVTGPRRTTTRAAAAPSRTLTRGFQQSDALLADLMTEMIGLGEQITDLRRRVDGLSLGQSPTAASETRNRRRQKTFAA